MKNIRLLLALLGFTGGFVVAVTAAENSWSGNAVNAEGKILAQITVDNSTTASLAAWGKHAGEICAAWYPKINSLLASDGFVAPPTVRLKFRNDWPEAVASTSGNVISISSDYVSRHPNDLGLIVHELTHVVQSYPPGGPVWLVEGIADYIRLSHFEPHAPQPAINPARASYRDSYKTAATFLAWIEKNHDAQIVKQLNQALREQKYKNELFRDYTGKTVDELWSEFADSLRGQVAMGQSSDMAEKKSLVTLANPLMGTDSTGGFSHGNEYPAIALPFPMNTWAPYTEPQRDSFFYQYSHRKIRGIRQTHQPSPWIGDYAMFSLLPVSGKLVVNDEDRASDFSHANEVAQPSYYSVYLDTWKAKAEVTPTERCARFRFTFDAPGDSYVILDEFDKGASVQIIPGENKIIGAVRYHCGQVPDIYSSNYFVIIFDRPFATNGVWSGNKIQSGVTQLAGESVGAFLKFDTSKDKVVGCKVASSFISPEQAMQNLQREIGDADFDTIHQRADAQWNQAFGRARVEGGSDEQRRTFYSCLYRCVMFPHKFYEVDANGKQVYFSPYDGKLHDGVLYTDSGFWDTFRAAQPLYNLLFPEVNAEILQGVVNASAQSGWLPAWASPGHRACMVGNNSFSLLADGWFKGVRSFDANQAVDAMVHDSQSSGPIPSIGRDGAKFYHRLGYVPYSPVKGETSFSEATAKTLEYAYDDFCAAKLALATGRNADAEKFARSAMNWTNVFDAKIGFVRERKEDGSWVEPFYPNQWGGGFTEGCSWHWTWCVFHDIPGLMKLMGGDDAFIAKLDGVFTAPNDVRTGSYGGMIHEMTEMVAADMGQYAHGNQPIQHMIYLYDYAGQPWKTQSRTRWAMGKLYAPTPDGYCGDEDNGQTSAWYVFSALGFYPVCPGDDHYLIGSPLFDKATITTAKGKSFTITAENNGPLHPYIQSAKLNGENFNQTFLSHDELLNGGGIVFQMTSAPEKKWGSAPESRPPSGMAALGELIAEKK